MTQENNAPDLSSFGAVTVLRPLPGGHRNSVWLAEREGGKVVAKATRRSAEALEWLSPVQGLARAEGFIVPEMIRAADGGLAPQGWVLEPYIEGRTAVEANLASLAPRVAGFHRRSRGMAQRPGFRSSRDLIGQDHGGDVDMTALPAELITACRAAWARMTGVEVALHGDLGAGNVILTAQGPALIDWDEARVDLPMFDAPIKTALQRRAQLAWEIACNWQREPEYARERAAVLLAQS